MAREKNGWVESAWRTVEGEVHRQTADFQGKNKLRGQLYELEPETWPYDVVRSRKEAFNVGGCLKRSGEGLAGSPVSTTAER